MKKTPVRKLTKAQRYEQLLATAQVIVREQGTGALTLGYLAERAGVSKPIAYAHFKTRSGLLIALYRQLDERHLAALGRALGRAPQRLEDVARVISRGYMSCYTPNGSEWHAIAAALKGDEEMDTFQNELVDNYVAIFRDALAPYCTLSKRRLTLRCVGIIGAAEAISREITRERLGEAAATKTLASLIVNWLSD